MMMWSMRGNASPSAIVDANVLPSDSCRQQKSWNKTVVPMP